MITFLDRVNSVPINNDKFSFEINLWLANLVDVLNENYLTLENAINLYNNGLIVPSFTTVEITDLATAAPNGTMWYDTTTNNLKAKVNGIVVILA